MAKPHRAAVCGRATRGGILRRVLQEAPPCALESDEITRTITWGQGGAAACSKESILNLCWWPGSSLLTLSPASWSAAWSQYQIFGDIRSSPLHHNGPGTPPVQLQTSPIRPRCLSASMHGGWRPLIIDQSVKRGETRQTRARTRQSLLDGPLHAQTKKCSERLIAFRAAQWQPKWL